MNSRFVTDTIARAPRSACRAPVKKPREHQDVVEVARQRFRRYLPYN